MRQVKSSAQVAHARTKPSPTNATQVVRTCRTHNARIQCAQHALCVEVSIGNTIALLRSREIKTSYSFVFLARHLHPLHDRRYGISLPPSPRLDHHILNLHHHRWTRRSMDHAGHCAEAWMAGDDDYHVCLFQHHPVIEACLCCFWADDSQDPGVHHQCAVPVAAYAVDLYQLRTSAET